MALRLRLTADGPAALVALQRAVGEAKGGDPLAPVTVLVPTNTAGVLARRALGRAGGIAAVQFLTVFRLAELLGGPSLAAVRRAPLSSAVANATVRAVLAEAPGRFAPVHEHPTTVAAVVAASRELRQLPAAAVRRLTAEGTGLTPDLVRVHEAARRRTAANWHDEADLLDAASDAVSAAVAARLGTVIVHLPTRVTVGGVRLLQRLAAHTDVLVHLAWCEDPQADRVAERLATRFEQPLPDPPADRPVRSVETVSVSDADEEVRAAVRLLVGAAQEGTPLERMAVVWCASQPYQRIVGEQLDGAGLAWNGPSPVGLAERLAGRSLLAILELDRFGLRRTDLFALVGNAPFRDRQGAPVPSAAWERVSRAAGVGRGHDWSERLSEFAVRRRADADDAELEGDEDRAGRLRRDADHADHLRAFVEWIGSELGPPGASRRWQDWAEWSHRLLRVLLGGATLRARFPAVEQHGFDRVEHALDRLGELDAVAPPPNRHEFRAALVSALDAELLRRGRIGDGVLVGPLSSAIGLATDLVIVLGLAEGVFPPAPSIDPLLGESERRRVAPLLPLADDELAEQRRALVAALSAASRVVVCVPRGDLRHSCRRTVCSWLAELVPGPPVRTHDVPSFAHGIIGVAFPSTTLDHRVRSLLAHRRAGASVHDHPLARTDIVLARGLRTIRARLEPRLTRYDGDLGGLGLPSPFDPEVVMAATRLETWVACPHRYFLQYVLRVPEPDDRDARLRISPLDRGSLMHTTLDRFLRVVLGGELPVPAPSEPWSPAHARLAMALLEEECERARRSGLTGRDALWERDRMILRAEVGNWLVRDSAERADRGLVPEASERRFGFPGADWQAAVVELPDGRSMRFRGSIDRLDRTAAGSLLVTDHKTGGSRRFEDIDRDPFAKGSKLQLAAYAAAVSGAEGRSPVGVTAEYSFTRTGRRIGYQVTDEIWATFRQILEVVGEGIAGGLFPMRPEPPGFQLRVECAYCDPDGLGTGEAHRRWLAKQADPRLERYLRLIGDLSEPDADPGP